MTSTTSWLQLLLDNSNKQQPLVVLLKPTLHHKILLILYILPHELFKIVFLPLRIKNKIWNDKFIDLKCLLPNFKEEKFSIQIENNAIQFTSQSLAFFIFVAIYTEMLPQEHANLLKYCFTVRKIASSNGDGAWRYYDENLRKLRQSNKASCLLSITEYMVKACTLTHSSRPSQTSSSRTKATQRVCFN